MDWFLFYYVIIQKKIVNINERYMLVSIIDFKYNKIVIALFSFSPRMRLNHN